MLSTNMHIYWKKNEDYWWRMRGEIEEGSESYLNIVTYLFISNYNLYY